MDHPEVLTTAQLTRALQTFVDTKLQGRKTGLGAQGSNSGVDDFDQVWSTDVMDNLGRYTGQESGTLTSRLDIIAQALQQSRSANDVPISLYFQTESKVACTDEDARHRDSQPNTEDAQIDSLTRETINCFGFRLTLVPAGDILDSRAAGAVDRTMEALDPLRPSDPISRCLTAGGRATRSEVTEGRPFGWLSSCRTQASKILERIPGRSKRGLPRLSGRSSRSAQ